MTFSITAVNEDEFVTEALMNSVVGIGFIEDTASAKDAIFRAVENVESRTEEIAALLPGNTERNALGQCVHFAGLVEGSWVVLKNGQSLIWGGKVTAKPHWVTVHESKLGSHRFVVQVEWLDSVAFGDNQIVSLEKLKSRLTHFANGQRVSAAKLKALRADIVGDEFDVRTYNHAICRAIADRALGRDNSNAQSFFGDKPLTPLNWTITQISLSSDGQTFELANPRTNAPYAGGSSLVSKSAIREVSPSSGVLGTMLKRAKNIVLEGVPGTGKTYAVKQIVQNWRLSTDRDLKGTGSGAFACTLHAATAYEDFVEGLRPGSTDNDRPSLTETNPRVGGARFEKQPRWFFETANDSSTGAPFVLRDGFFVRACAEAARQPKYDFIVLLDEINRCNIPKVMGDLLTTIEHSKRANWDDSNQEWDVRRCQIVTLPYSGRAFFVPGNLYVVATQNTTDRSVAPMDAALRRRFAFARLEPMPPADLERQAWAATQVTGDIPESLQKACKTYGQLNGYLEEAAGPDALLGHSYLFDLAMDIAITRDEDEQSEIVRHHWQHHILPQLAELCLVYTAIKAEEIHKRADIIGIADKGQTGLRAPIFRWDATKT